MIKLKTFFQTNYFCTLYKINYIQLDVWYTCNNWTKVNKQRTNQTCVLLMNFMELEIFIETQNKKMKEKKKDIPVVI